MNVNFVCVHFYIILYTMIIMIDLLTTSKVTTILCLSHKTTPKYLDKLGCGHDDKVMKWAESLKKEMLPSEVRIIILVLNILLLCNSLIVLLLQTSSQQEEPVVVSARPDIENQPPNNNFNPPQAESFQINLSALPSSSDSSTHSSVRSGEPSPSSSLSASSFCDLSSSETIYDTSSQSTSSTSQSSETSSQRPTYKLVGDNIDKNVKPREMRSDHQTRSLHYFHTYAVRDRVDMSSYSDDIQILPY